MKNPPILIAVIGFFAALAGFGLLFFGLRVLGFDWFGAFGDPPPLENVGLWGWLAVATGIVWLLVAFGLWSLRPYARLFAQIVAGIGLLQAVLAFFQFPGHGHLRSAWGSCPLLILWYLGTDEVKEAFGIGAKPAGALDATPVGYATTAAAVAHEEPAHPAAAPVAAAASSPQPRHGSRAGSRGAGRRRSRGRQRGLGRAGRPGSTRRRSAATRQSLLRPHRRAGSTMRDRGRRRDRPGRSREARGGRHHHDRRPPPGRREARGPRAHRGGLGISSTLILEWVNHVDLMRIKGVGSEYSDLLEAAGVDSPAELAQRNATQPRDHGPGGRRRATGHRPSSPDGVGDRGLDPGGPPDGQGGRALIDRTAS